MPLNKNIPVFGSWLLCRYVRRVGKQALQGNVTVLTELCIISCATKDTKVQKEAFNVLGTLQESNLVRALFEEAIVWNNQLLNSCIEKHCSNKEYEHETALFLFACDHRRYLAFDPYPHGILSRAYSKAKQRVRDAVCRSAIKNGQGSVLGEFLFSTASQQGTPAFSDMEWEILLSLLTNDGRWRDLRTVVFSAPVPKAVLALQALKNAGSADYLENKNFLHKILQGLPPEWKFPLLSLDPVKSIEPGDGPVTIPVFSHDGALVAAGVQRNGIRVWRIGGRSSTSSFSQETGYETPLVFSADSQSLIYEAGSGTIASRNVTSGKLQWQYCRRSSNIRILALAQSRSFMVLEEASGILVVLSLTDGTAILTVPVSGSPVCTIALSPDDSLILIGCLDGSVYETTISTGITQRIFEKAGEAVQRIAITRDREILVLFRSRSPVFIAGSRRISIALPGRDEHAAVSPDGEFIALRTAGNVQIRRCKNGALIRTIPGSSRMVTVCEFTPDGSFLAVGYNNGTLRVAPVNPNLPVRERRAHRKGIHHISFSGDSRLLATSSGDRSLRVWNARTVEPEKVLMEASGSMTGVALLDNGNLIACGDSNGSLNAYRQDTGEIVRTFSRYSRSVRTVASNEQGDTLVFAGENRTLWTWNRKDDSLKTCELARPPRCLAFIPGENSVVAGGWDGNLRIYEIPGGKKTGVLQGHTSIVTSCVISPQGEIVASGSNDRTVRIWSRRNQRALRVIRDCKTEVGALAISPDSRYLVVGSSDDAIRVYTIPEGNPDSEIRVVAGELTSLAFSENGQILIAGCHSGNLLLIYWPERKVIHRIPAHAGPVTSVTPMPGMNTIVTGGIDSILRFWELPTSVNPSDIPMDQLAAIAGQTHSIQQSSRNQWIFLHGFLAARYSTEIEICSDTSEIYPFDIEVAG